MVSDLIIREQFPKLLKEKEHKTKQKYTPTKEEAYLYPFIYVQEEFV
jgi:hypothetical protein